jgi:hypothetical protein
MTFIANCGVEGSSEGSEEEGAAAVVVVVVNVLDVVILVIGSELVVRELIFLKVCG